VNDGGGGGMAALTCDVKRGLPTDLESFLRASCELLVAYRRRGSGRLQRRGRFVFFSGRFVRLSRSRRSRCSRRSRLPRLGCLLLQLRLAVLETFPSWAF
jgi:hypothetical protein